VSHGKLVLIDGVYSYPEASDDQRRRGYTRMGALAPRVGPSIKPGGTTFVVELNYRDSAYFYRQGRRPFAADIAIQYSREFKRLASGGNPLKDAVSFIAPFSGCDEAKKVRGRAIALSRIRKSISGETFRFPLEAP